MTEMERRLINAVLLLTDVVETLLTDAEIEDEGESYEKLQGIRRSLYKNAWPADA